MLSKSQEDEEEETEMDGQEHVTSKEDELEVFIYPFFVFKLTIKHLDKGKQKWLPFPGTGAGLFGFGIRRSKSIHRLL